MGNKELSIKKNPTVIIFSPTMAGGVGRFVVNLANGLAGSYRVVILAVKKSDGDYKPENNNISFIYIGSRRTLTSIYGLIKYIKKERPSIVLSACFYANIVAGLSRWFSGDGCKTIFTEHSTLTWSLKDIPQPKRFIMLFLMKFFYRSADKIVAVSEDAKRDIIKITGVAEKKVCVVYNPVVSPNLYEMAEEKITHPWFENGSVPVVVSVGRLEKQKDFSTLIRAFDKARIKIDARLMIIGDGSEKNKLNDLINKINFKKDVSLLGFIKNPYPYIKKANLFVLSSIWEGLPTVLIEALALGTPLVSTECAGGASEILEGGRWGSLVPVGDADSLAVGIVNMLNLKNKINKIDGEVLKKYSVEFSAREYMKIFNSL